MHAPDPVSFVSQLADGRTLLAVLVQPRASRTALVGIHDQALKVALTAPPVDDAANRALLAFVASFLKISRQRILLHQGHQSRRKLLVIEGLSPEIIRERILAALPR